MNKELLLEVSGIDKSFGPTRALNDVAFRVYRGEVRGLVGENGSGKSTVSSIIAGFQKADRGTMTLRGQDYRPKDMMDAQAQGVAMVVQEAGTIPGTSVAENLFVGKEGRFRRFGLVSRKAMVVAAQGALEKIGVTDIDPALPIGALTFEDRKLVEIARALYEDPDLFIVDETTTALSQRGREVVYRLMNQLRDAGKSVLFVSHDLDELMATCDVLTVLRDGVLIDNLDRASMEPETIKSLMVGRKVEGDYYRPDYDGTHGSDEVLRFDQLTVGEVLENFSGVLHKGEILGIGGLSGSGMHELGRAAFGVDRAVTGTVTHVPTGTVLTNPGQAVRRRIGYVSKNRDTEALILQASIQDNILLPSYSQVGNRGVISKKAARKFAAAQVDLMRVKCASPDQLVAQLSGGNKQKVVFSRWLGNGSEVLILDCPTRGIDIGVKTAMYQLMTRFKREGKAILLISEELTELIGMADRILILKDGAVAREFARSPQLTEQDLIQVMI